MQKQSTVGWVHYGHIEKSKSLSAVTDENGGSNKVVREIIASFLNVKKFVS